MSRNAPCKDCKDRYAGCHSKCEKYQTYRREQDIFLKEEIARRAVVSAFCEIRRGK